MSVSLGNTTGGVGAGINNGSINATFHLPAHRPETPPDPSSTVPFQRDPDFVERPVLLDQISKKLSFPGAKAALVGLGGAGKTQLAVEYARRVRERSPQTWVLWVHASTAARFEQSVRDIAERMKIGGRDDPNANIFRLLQMWLCVKKRGKWLMVLDNVDDASFLRAKPATAEERRLIDYLPECEHGSTLITSRNKREAQCLTYESQIIEITPMGTGLAEELLQRKLGSDEQARHSQLAEALDFMPLAIAQAAAYIRERSPRCSVEHYLTQLEESSSSRTSLLRHNVPFPARDREASNSILKTWQISFEHIFRTKQSAADLLSLMSFCDRQAIPEILVRDKHSSKDQDSLDETRDDGFEEDVVILRSYSFISPTTDHRTWEMHRLVQDATRMWLEDRCTFEAFKERFICRLDKVFPYQAEYEDWQICQVLFPHARSMADQKPSSTAALLNWASVMYNAAWYSYLKGQVGVAETMALDSMQTTVSALGEDNARAIDSTSLVAHVVRSFGRFDEAEKLDLKLIETARAVLGPDHPDTLNVTAGLGHTYIHQKRWKEAEQLQVKVTETMNTVLGPDHPDMIVSMVSLAVIYCNQRRWKEAEQLLVKAIDTMNTVLGPDHPSTLISMGSLAATYHNQRRWKEAEQLQVKVTETMNTVLGPDHHDTLINIANLAVLYYDQGRWEEAEQLQTRVVDGRAKVLGTDHPDTLKSVANLELYRRKLLQSAAHKEETGMSTAAPRMEHRDESNSSNFVYIREH